MQEKEHRKNYIIKKVKREPYGQNSMRARIKRTYKDSVFRKLFSNPDTLLELYNAMNGSNYTDSGELEINTLGNAIYLGMKNDVSFIFNNELFLYEHQSTVNPNMPFRNLMYVTDILRKKYYNKSIYSHILIKLPSPKFVVFYNGTENIPEQNILRLSDAYEDNAKDTSDTYPDISLDLKVVVINLNGCYNENIKRNCRTLADYQTYVSLIRKYVEDMPIEEAVEKSIDECIKNDVLKEFLEKERAEIMALSVFEFDKEREFRIVREDERKLGHEEGFNEGVKCGLERGLKQGIERGIERGIEQGICEGEHTARISDIMDLLSEHGTLPENIRTLISSEKNTDKLKSWLKLAARTDSIESFEAQM